MCFLTCPPGPEMARRPPRTLRGRRQVSRCSSGSQPRDGMG